MKFMLNCRKHGEVPPIVIQDRVDYASMMNEGGTVCEFNSKGNSAKEIGELWQYLLSKFEAPKKEKKDGLKIKKWHTFKMESTLITKSRKNESTIKNKTKKLSNVRLGNCRGVV